eukprot:15443419-Alexandrium_andersonii.AAC.1
MRGASVRMREACQTRPCGARACELHVGHSSPSAALSSAAQHLNFCTAPAPSLCPVLFLPSPSDQRFTRVQREARILAPGAALAVIPRPIGPAPSHNLAKS